MNGAHEKEHNESAKLFSRLSLHCGAGQAEAIARGVGLTENADSGKKSVWVRHVVSAMEAALSPQDIRAVRIQCHCDEEGKLDVMKRWLGDLYRRSWGMDDFIRRVNEHGAGWYREGEWLCTKFLTCECHMLGGVEALSSKTWCYCTEGYTRNLFRHVFDCEVDSELVHTIKMGHAFCLVKIRKREGSANVGGNES